MTAVIIILVIIFILLCAWLFSISGAKADFTEFKKYDYAHRGLHDKDNGVPENSEKAFDLAVKCGFGMEFDLQLTQDGYVVVHHDHSIARSCGVDKKISDMSLGEVRSYNLFGTREKIPLFSDVLNLVDGKTPLIIELKGYNSPEELCPKVMEILKDYKGLYCIESFDPRIVKWFKDHFPSIVRGQLMEHLHKNEVINEWQAFIARNMMTNFITRPHFEAYDFHNRDIPAIYAARRMGLQEVSWTIRKEEDYKKVKALGNLCIFEGFIPAEADRTEKMTLSDVMEAARKQGAAPATAQVNAAETSEA